jgi:DNA-binding CsgD family transcriptional regulator
METADKIGIDWAAIETPDDMKAVARHVFDRFNISCGVLSFTPIASLPGGRPGLLRRALTVDFDESVIKHWFEYNDDITGPAKTAVSQSFDPIRRRMSQRILPKHFVLKDLVSDKDFISNVVASEWLQAIMKMGIRESFHIPIFTNLGEYWSLLAFRYNDNPVVEPLSEEDLATLHWIALNFVSICVERFGWREQAPEHVKYPLTQRELDCLFWAAQGYSAVETAEILNIKSETVRQYIKQALKKLNARNKTQGIWLAHRLGYLSLG